MKVIHRPILVLVLLIACSFLYAQKQPALGTSLKKKSSDTAYIKGEHEMLTEYALNIMLDDQQPLN